MTLMPWTPRASMALRSAWMPAPPPLSEPATVRTRGGAAAWVLMRPNLPTPRGGSEHGLGFDPAVLRDGLELDDGVGDRGEVDLGAAQRGEVPERALVDGFDGVPAEAGGEDAVERGGGAAALGVAEDDRAGLLAEQVLQSDGEPGADA